MQYFGLPNAGRKMLSSDEDDSSSGSGRRTGRSWDSKVSLIAKEMVQDLDSKGKINCPPPQCLTEDQDLLMSLATAAQPSSEKIGPWYHQSNDGYCGWQCDGVPQEFPWCNSKVENCMACNGAWCPNGTADASGDAVTRSNYVPKSAWYTVTTEGFCAWNTNCNANGNSSPSDWCSSSKDKCLGCSGTWCPPDSMSGIWEPNLDLPEVSNTHLGCHLNAIDQVLASTDIHP
eukprot:scaffold95255_cov44-Prasinocladus_malaysianus.AAC.1